MEALIRSSDGACIAAGPVVMAMYKTAGCEWIWEPPDTAMAKAFRHATYDDPALPELLEAVEAHQSVVYLIKNEPGVSALEEITGIADFCLAAGGIAVKSETARRGFSRHRWRGEKRPLGPVLLRDLYVCPVIKSDQVFYSCGMNQFGERDTIVCSQDPAEASEVIRIFQLYQLLEGPELKNRQTFAVEAGATTWIMEEAEHPYADDPYIDFSKGAWKLTKADEYEGAI